MGGTHEGFILMGGTNFFLELSLNAVTVLGGWRKTIKQVFGIKRKKRLSNFTEKKLHYHLKVASDIWFYCIKSFHISYKYSTIAL